MEDSPPTTDASYRLTGEVARLNDETHDRYIKDKKLGEGTYAVVFKGFEKATGRKIAIKKIKIASSEQGLSLDSLREIKYLKEIRHENIIELLDVFVGNSFNIHAVLEFLAGDLEGIIRDAKNMYSVADIKSWMAMSFRGLYWCHRNGILHRDIKPNNLLYSTTGVLKLADFGLARSFAEPYQIMSTQVITRWYRPPELFFGATHYSGAVDVWSMGIIMIELLKHTPWIAGDSDAQQIIQIMSFLGTPTEANWPGVTTLPNYMPPEVKRPEVDLNFWRQEFPQIGPKGQMLLSQILKLDPRKRCTTKQALESEWFSCEPYPTPPHKLPIKVDDDAEEKMGQDLKRRAGLDEFMDGSDMDMGGRGKKLARKLDFGM